VYFEVSKSLLLYNYLSRFISQDNYFRTQQVIQNSGGFPSIWELKMSLLGDRKCECPGFSSFLVTFFFSFQKEKKKVTERFEIKEEL